MSNQQFAIVAGALGLGVWWLVSRIPEAAEAAADVVQGRIGDPSSPYYGRGIPGTLGSVANAASGGSLQAAGEAFGDWLYGAVHGEGE